MPAASRYSLQPCNLVLEPLLSPWWRYERTRYEMMCDGEHLCSAFKSWVCGEIFPDVSSSSMGTYQISILSLKTASSVAWVQFSHPSPVRPSKEKWLDAIRSVFRILAFPATLPLLPSGRRRAYTRAGLGCHELCKLRFGSFRLCRELEI